VERETAINTHLIGSARTSRNAIRATARRCRRCGTAFAAARETAVWCSGACRVAAHRAARAGAPISTIPAAVELPSGAQLDGRADNVGPGSSGPRPIAARLSAVPVEADHDHSPRLCATCMTRRHEEIRPARRSHVSAELVARQIRADAGNVWPACRIFGVSYRHALEIRAGWRGDGRRAEPIPYTAGAWTNGRKHGWSAERELALVGSREELGETIRRAMVGA